MPQSYGLDAKLVTSGSRFAVSVHDVNTGTGNLHCNNKNIGTLLISYTTVGDINPALPINKEYTIIPIV